MNSMAVGVDIAKTVFQVHYIDQAIRRPTVSAATKPVASWGIPSGVKAVLL